MGKIGYDVWQRSHVISYDMIISKEHMLIAA